MKKLSWVLVLFLSLPILAVATVDDSGVTAKGTATVENAEPQELVEPASACALVSEDSPAWLMPTEGVLDELLGGTEVAFACTRCGCEPDCCLNREGTLCLNSSGGICLECPVPQPEPAGHRSTEG